MNNTIFHWGKFPSFFSLQAAKTSWSLKSLLRDLFDDRSNIIILSRLTLEAVGQFFIWLLFIGYGKPVAKAIFGDFEREKRSTRGEAVLDNSLKLLLQAQSRFGKMNSES